MVAFVAVVAMVGAPVMAAVQPHPADRSATDVFTSGRIPSDVASGRADVSVRRTLLSPTGPRAARSVLARAAAAVHGADVDGRGRRVNAGRHGDLTVLLRDLAGTVRDLSGSDRVRARALLARPTDGFADPEGFGYPVASTVVCGTTVCVHWVPTSQHAPPAVDVDATGVPDQVEATLRVTEEALGVLTGTLGYRPPVPDTAADPTGDPRLDVYLADTGTVGAFGYCAPDDPGQYQRRQVASYCVLDNDFSLAQFPGTDPVGSLQVTAAHELFHAVQFGYDWLEDLWLMEGTAAWVEDIVYDHVDDNLRYLSSSALAEPHYPLDAGSEDRRYGSWVWWQFLTERFGSDTAPDPTVIRQVWEATAPAGVPDRHSLQALAAALWHRDTTVAKVFGEFATVGQYARRWYFEGAQLVNARPDKQHRLSARDDDTDWWSAELDHLTSATATFTPARSLPRDARLRVKLDLPSRRSGATAMVAVHKVSGKLAVYRVRLGASGGARVSFSFSRSKVDKVVLTLANGSTRVSCGLDTEFTCAGLSRDDLRQFSYRAVVID